MRDMEKIKYGVSYNIFDGSELLEVSIRSLREEVDHVNVVYSLVSNSGKPLNEPLEDLLNDLMTKGLVDEIFLYKPKVEKGQHWNELEKRRIGSFISSNNECKYHLTADSDEIYKSEQLKYIKKIYEEENLVTSYCQMQTFYKSSKYCFKTPEEYFITLFSDISNGNTYEWNAHAPVLVDPTRKMNIQGNYKIFSRNEIEMFHMSGVRKDYRKKLENSSASVNFLTEIDRLVSHYENFDFEKDPRALWPGAVPCQYHQLVEVVDDSFKINF